MSQSQSPSKRTTSVQIIAKKWGVSENTVRRLVEEGSLAGFKVRRCYKISQASVDEYELKNAF